MLFTMFAIFFSHSLLYRECPSHRLQESFHYNFLEMLKIMLQNFEVRKKCRHAQEFSLDFQASDSESQENV